MSHGTNLSIIGQALTDTLVLYKLVAGLSDEELQKELFKKTQLSLAEVEKMTVAAESAKYSQEAMTSDSTSSIRSIFKKQKIREQPKSCSACNKTREKDCPAWSVVRKTNGSPRRTVDIQKLNAATLRQTHPEAPPYQKAMLVPEGMFKKLTDAFGRHHSVPLDPESSKLTQFITPFGCYCYQPAGQPCVRGCLQQALQHVHQISHHCLEAGGR